MGTAKSIAREHPVSCNQPHASAVRTDECSYEPGRGTGRSVVRAGQVLDGARMQSFRFSQIQDDHTARYEPIN